MSDVIYIESEIRQHPRTRTILQRFPQADVIECQRYNELFNRKAQHFALQKRRPALILAQKHQGRLLPTPPGYGIGGKHNYYFSHMLNCVYDCRYCFLQGRYRSANYVLFVNYEDFFQDMQELLIQHAPEPVWFFSGYDCDSLAYEPVSEFVRTAYDFLTAQPQAHMELRSKSTQIRDLLRLPALPNIVVAGSFTPAVLSRALEHGVPEVTKRIDALARLQQAGWNIGLRFDPLIYQHDFEQQYHELFDTIFSRLDAARIHSVTLGVLRLPAEYLDTMQRIYPREKLLATLQQTRQNRYSYTDSLEQSMIRFCQNELQNYISAERFYSCALWDADDVCCA